MRGSVGSGETGPGSGQGVAVGDRGWRVLLEGGFKPSTRTKARMPDEERRKREDEAEMREMSL